MAQATPQDHWSHKAYQSSASYVPKLAAKVQQLLDPQPSDLILDVGCGDGILTAELATKCRSVVGLDASRSMIASATEAYKSSHTNAVFYDADCRRLDASLHQLPSEVLQPASYDKVFSNAALHWILREGEASQLFFRDVAKLLKPNGLFAFEMGGAGNIAEVHAALRSVLHHSFGVPLEAVEKADPWFFPSQKWMQEQLEGAGLEVIKIETEYRPTRMTETSSDGSGGLEGFLKLMGSNFFETLSTPQQREDAISQTYQCLRPVCTHTEDGSQWLGYVRLRAVARLAA